MAESVWDPVQFEKNLCGVLTESLARGRDEKTFSRLLTVCAEAAEVACAGRPLDCAAGCPHCCVLNVATLLPEGMVIAGWLRYRLESSELENLRGRLAAHRSWARWMDDEERIIRKASCPFLNGAGLCAIHPVRPLVCRAVASSDRNACRKAFDPTISDRPRLVASDMVRQAAYDAAFTALAQALENAGLDDRSMELGTAVLAFLEEPDCHVHFLSGKRLPGHLWEYPSI